MKAIEIRKATIDDLPEMQSIARHTINRCHRAFLGDEGVDWFINSGGSDKELSTHMEKCDVLRDDGTIVGFAIYFADLIHLMMIDVDLHRTGLGSHLLAHCEQELANRGHSILRLETFKGNDQAIAFYLKNGWHMTGEQQDEEHDFIRVFFEKHSAQCTVQAGC